MTHIKQIHLRQFRNFNNTQFTFYPGINQIIGENGTGKTNLLEAISLFSTGRSFRTSNLKELVQKDKTSFHVKIVFEKDNVTQTLSFTFNPFHKVIRHNSTEYKSFSKLLGLLPSIVYSPYDLALIEGLPQNRRRFINIHIAQSDPLYAYHLTRYAKCLSRRNALLKQQETQSITIWEEELTKCAHYLITKRKKAIEELSYHLKKHYYHLSQKKEEPAMHYFPSLETAPTPTVWAQFREKEFKYGHTLIGPHRDDFHFHLTHQYAKTFASEGQKRTLIAALKLSERARLDCPFLAIDDFSAHLDPTRRRLLLDQIKDHHQIFLTAPEPLDLKSNIINLKI